MSSELISEHAIFFKKLEGGGHAPRVAYVLCAYYCVTLAAPPLNSLLRPCDSVHIKHT